MRVASALILFVLAGSTCSGSVAAVPGETYTCHFGQYGTVVIDTREPGSTITVGGKSYSAKAGMDDYQTEDGKIAFFSFNKSGWAYVDANVDPSMKSIIDRHCVRHANGQ